MRILLHSIKIFLIIAFMAQLVYAQSGKISGRVTDANTQEPLAFVNVIVEGTTLGAASNLEGFYNILNVPPGVYNIKASAIGFNSVTTKQVRVSIDLTSKVDFQLSETSIQINKDVVITATKPLVTKDLTASTALIGADEIAVLPVTEFQEVLKLKAGNVGGSVRGGRKGEVVYAIDGVPMTDVFDGGTVVDVSTSSIQELQFISGAFNAEYGKALSGYVNIATKDGNNKFDGTVTAYVGDYYSTHTDIFRDINKFNPINIRNLEGSFSGPIVPNLIYFYSNVRYIYFNGYLKGQRIFHPWDITTNLGSSEPIESRYQIQATGDGEIVPMNWNEKFYGQGKLTMRPVKDIKLTYNYILDNVKYRDYDQSFTYNPDGDYKKFRRGITNILGITHTLGASTFYQLNFSYFFKKYWQYVYEDWDNPLYTNSELLGQNPSDFPSFKTGGTNADRFKRSTSTYGIKYDITSQINQVHQLKAGVEFNNHNLYFENVQMLQDASLGDPSVTGNPYAKLRIPDINNPEENLRIDIYKRKPVEFSAYIQDKIELNELIINLGVRFDYFHPDGKLLNDPSDPDIYRPRKASNIAETLEQRLSHWYKNPTDKSKISPRLGVAFPITDRGVIHFSYGHFFQIPNFDLLYTNPEYKFGTGTDNLGIAGNPDLSPQQTVSGEVGLQQALTDELSVDITAYFRDIRNLAGTRADEIYLSGGAGRYSQYVNSDFGFVKGIILTVSKRLSNNWSATIDYTFQIAKGNASDPAATRNQLVSGAQPEVQLVRLNWDQTHTLNGTFSYTSEDNWGFSLIGTWGSGFPYTPTQSMNISNLLTNAELKPTTFNVDLRAYKDFMFDPIRLSIFARVYNLFDIKNQNSVYNDSGTADFTLDEFLRRQQNLNISSYGNKIPSLDEYYRNPGMYSEPRRIEVGATIFF